MFDPIALPMTVPEIQKGQIIIDPFSKVVLPCDVLQNRKDEIGRQADKHGSCGMGIFRCWERSKTNPIYAQDLFKFDLYSKIKNLVTEEDSLYNLDNFMKAVDWVKLNCTLMPFGEAAESFETINFEGGQGLRLSMDNDEDFPHLTPSYTGSNNIISDILKLGVTPNIYYVSRSYMTRHGAGPFPTECRKEDINPAITDLTNQPNPWQDSIRYGKLDLAKMQAFIKKDLSLWGSIKVNPNIVFTHLNYTDGKLKDISGDIDATSWKPDIELKKWYSSDKLFVR